MSNPQDSVQRQIAGKVTDASSEPVANLDHSTSTKLIIQVHDSRFSQTDATVGHGNQKMKQLEQKGVLPTLHLSPVKEGPVAHAATIAGVAASPDAAANAASATTVARPADTVAAAASKVNVPTERTTIDKGDGPVYVKTPNGEREINNGSYDVHTYPNGDQYFEFTNGFKADLKTDSKGTLTVRSWNDSGRDGANLKTFYADGAEERDNKDGSGETFKPMPDGSQLIHSWSQDQYDNNYDQAISANGLNVTTRYLNGRTLTEERDVTDGRPPSPPDGGYEIYDNGLATTPYPGHLTSKGPEAANNYQLWTNFRGENFIKYDDGVKRNSDGKDLSGTNQVPQRKNGTWVDQ